MGSGRGKSRRTQARRVFVEMQDVLIDSAVWTAFVDEQGLSTVRLSDYYDLHRPSLTTSGPRDDAYMEYQGKLANELFRDLVGVGAIRLPAGNKAEDFSCEVVGEEYGVGPGYYRQRLSLCRGAEKQSVSANPGRYLNDSVKMSGNLMSDIIYYLGAAAAALTAPVRGS